MANPFLFEDTADYGETTAVPFNPFLCDAEEPVNDNPFLTSVSTAPGTNPFADYSWDEPTGNDAGLLTPPPDPIKSINDPENDFIASSDDEVIQPRRPPPPRVSMPKETQDLILSVTGALKATSDHLLDRLPPTRAPSPTSFADLHSPSPTPDLLGAEDNFLSMTQQPARPPPPRPPVRPAPPAVPPAVAKPAPSTQSQNDMFDFFGTSPAPQPKSNDAILNLYSQPKPPPKDLLNDDTDVELPTPLISSEPTLSQTATVIENILGEEMTKTLNETITEPVTEVQLEPKREESFIFGTRPPPPTTLPNVVTHETSVKTSLQESTEEQLRSAQPSEALQEPEEVSLGETKSVSHFFGTEATSYQDDNIESNHSIFGSGSVSQNDASHIFGTNASEDETPQIFGVGPPPMEPASDIFSSEPPTAVNPPGLFEVEPPEAEPQPQLFGTGPPQPERQPKIFGVGPPPVAPRTNIFEPPGKDSAAQLFGIVPPSVESTPTIFGVGPPTMELTTQPVDAIDPFARQPVAAMDAFDAFSAKFDEAPESKGQGGSFDPFGGNSAPAGEHAGVDAWGSGAGGGIIDQGGFDGDDGFDAFLSMSQPPPAPQPTPSRMDRAESADSEEGGFNIFIKPREGEVYPQPGVEGPVPVLAPPPKSPAYADNDPRFNPFDKNGQIPAFPLQEGFQLPALSQTEPFEGGFKRTDSQETPTTPLFDEDVSQPLEEFPRIHYAGDGWEMQLRHPNKKKITGQRFWKKIFVKLVYQGDNPVLQLYNLKEDKDPFQELPLQACYSVSDITAQQYDQFGKIFTIKLQYIFYKERPGVRPGQVTKAERITTKLSQFAAYAIQGDYQGVKEFGSDLKKLGLPVEHAPQISQLLKIGCIAYEDLKQFSVTIEECLFRMPVHRDRALTYKMEEVQITVVDEMFVDQDAFGHVEKQIARVRVFFLAFLSGMPDVELGMNDLWRQGKEVVGRHDIIPVVTEEWIRLESVEFHSCVQLDEYERTRTIKFKPPDACYIELMRFRIRPPKNRELPLQLKAVMCVTGNKVELRADVLVPGFTSRKLGQIPCEDVMIRFPIPECWIYLFRVEKHFRYGSVKSAHRRTGKIKGIERFLGAVENMEPSLMEVTSGQAKYEHQHRAIVWRMPRLPKEGQGAYTTHNLVCRMQLTSYDQIPDNLADYAYVEFTMPATTASHTTVRSVSLVDSPSDDPPEKYVRQLARLEYRVGIEHTQGEEMASYAAATITKPKAPPTEAPAASPLPPPESDSDSSG